MHLPLVLAVAILALSPMAPPGTLASQPERAIPAVGSLGLSLEDAPTVAAPKVGTLRLALENAPTAHQRTGPLRRWLETNPVRPLSRPARRDTTTGTLALPLE